MARFTPTIIDHFSNPRNCGRLASPDVSAFVGNPVCGDQIRLTAHIADLSITTVGFEAFGCSASLAIASILTERLSGMTISAVAELSAADIVKWSGGLAPDQQHVAELGAEVARRLAHNHHTGVTEGDNATCSH